MFCYFTTFDAKIFMFVNNIDNMFNSINVQLDILIICKEWVNVGKILLTDSN